MKTIAVSVKKYACEYCGEIWDTEYGVLDHEEHHQKVEVLNIGDDLTYYTPVKYYDWGREYETAEERKGKIIKKDVKKMKVLVELKSGARNWLHTWKERW